MTTEPCTVDWEFIRTLEGFQLKGYVPQSKDSNKSGVTIGSGFDIGQRNKLGLYAFNFSLPLLTKLLPYVSLKGQEARDCLSKHSLTLTKDEAEELDQKVRKVYERAIREQYDANSDYTFSFLDSAKQTVIMSVGFQYGDLKRRCPSFFNCITKGLWEEAVHELEDFGDAYTKRRLKEAALLRSSLKQNTNKGK